MNENDVFIIFISLDDKILMHKKFWPYEIKMPFDDLRMGLCLP